MPPGTSTPPDDFNLLQSILDASPELFIYILTFLRPFEAMGLTRTSHAFRAICLRAIRYDPFGYDPTMPYMEDLGGEFATGEGERVRYSRMQHQWQLLGNFDLSRANDLSGEPAFAREELGPLEELAEHAFSYLWDSLKIFLERTGVQNKPVVLYGSILKEKGKQYTDCLATLKIGECTCFSTNFRASSISDLQSYASIKLQHANPHSRIVQVPTRASGSVPFVWQRHAELRLVTHWLLANPNVTSGDLLLDKFCCVFCAIQLHALGFSKKILIQPGQQFKGLQWYNFAPIVMFFPDYRKNLWGAEVESRFAALRPRDKRQVLFYIVQLASTNQLRRRIQPTISAPTPEPVSFAPMPSSSIIASSSGATHFGSSMGSLSSPRLLSTFPGTPSSSSSSKEKRGVKRPYSEISAPNCEKCGIPRVRRVGYSVFWSCPRCRSTWKP